MVRLDEEIFSRVPFMWTEYVFSERPRERGKPMPI